MRCARCGDLLRDGTTACRGCGALLCEECAGDTGTCGRESCGTSPVISLDDIEQQSDQETFDDWWKRQ